MSEYVFRYASGYGCDMSALMDGGRVTVGEYFASESTDHYGTLHEEIVRCRDCKHFTPKGTHKFENGKVNEDYCDYVRGWMLQITPDGFCAWGERRTDD